MGKGEAAAKARRRAQASASVADYETFPEVEKAYNAFKPDMSKEEFLAWQTSINDAITDSGIPVYNSQDTDGFNASEQAAMGTYIGSGYRWMNDYLRAGKKGKFTKPAMIDTVRALIDRHVLPKAVVVYRGLRGDYAAEFNSMPIGTEFVDKGFTSTSLLQEAARDWSREAWSVMVIRAPKGTRAISPLRTDVLETELILQAGTRYRITGRRVFRDYIYTDVEVIDG